MTTGKGTCDAGDGCRCVFILYSHSLLSVVVFFWMDMKLKATIFLVGFAHVTRREARKQETAVAVLDIADRTLPLDTDT